MNRFFLKGNDAVVRGAILGGVTHFFGYPITPASEIAHLASELFPRSGGHFLQAEDEVNAINMLYGAAAAGSRVMTASSGPGISLMAEGISYIAASELPCVIVDIQRAGPGLGNIWPEQGDYDTVVTAGAHGNYKCIVFAPNSCQEMCDFAYRAFELAEKWRMPVFLLSDAYIGQMMEPVELPTKVLRTPRHPWALYGDSESRKNLVTSIFMSVEELEYMNIKLDEKFKRLQNELCEVEETFIEDAEIILVAYGISARICYTAVNELRKEGIKVGLFRPKILCPFPEKYLAKRASKAKKVISVELSNGQMFKDVRISVAKSNAEALLFNWMGGRVPSPKDIIEKLKKALSQG